MNGTNEFSICLLVAPGDRCKNVFRRNFPIESVGGASFLNYSRLFFKDMVSSNVRNNVTPFHVATSEIHRKYWDIFGGFSLGPVMTLLECQSCTLVSGGLHGLGWQIRFGQK